jgi:uncharacterized protein YbgA (DUF1722 family)/uncharacterized protein YbbK (DUF523 family)
MIHETIRPRVIVSRCIEFDHCRWNGAIISSPTVVRLEPFVEFVQVCPEADIGLGVPRPPIRLVDLGDGVRLVQPTSGKDITEEMNAFLERFLESVHVMDGAILKGSSPTCGTRNTKVYSGIEKAPVKRRGAGLFGQMIHDRYPGMPIESDERLANCRIKDHFLTALWTRTRFRGALESGRIRDLVDFHAKNKYLLSAYNQSAMRAMGRIVANQDGLDRKEIFLAYDTQLRRAMSQGPRTGGMTNALQHMFGYYSGRLSKEERDFYLSTLEAYRTNRVPLMACTQLIREYGIRFDDAYIRDQTILDPYPLQVFDQCELGGRDYWK